MMNYCFCSIYLREQAKTLELNGSSDVSLQNIFSSDFFFLKFPIRDYCTSSFCSPEAESLLMGFLSYVKMFSHAASSARSPAKVHVISPILWPLIQITSQKVHRFPTQLCIMMLAQTVHHKAFFSPTPLSFFLMSLTSNDKMTIVFHFKCHFYSKQQHISMQI